MKVLGIDPGMARTGWALLETSGDSHDVRRTLSGVLETSARAPVGERLRCLHRLLGQLLNRQRPDEVALEEIFFLKPARSLQAVGQARGIVLLACAEMSTPLFEYNPRVVKQFLTGNGNASKHQMQRMLQKVLAHREPFASDDAADAVAIALCHLKTSRILRMQAPGQDTPR
ncbi:MAG: crossover junction endodeoxyribonuclease RuvC [Elusimicrobia bacterium]|nr:crossover junction endodeoxyribonuclease RuvC [Elusimicrobiota bacterium]